MKEQNRQLVLSYELVHDNYVAKITIDKLKNTWSYSVFCPMGVRIAYKDDLKYESETKVANLIGEIIQRDSIK